MVRYRRGAERKAQRGGCSIAAWALLGSAPPPDGLGSWLSGSEMDDMCVVRFGMDVIGAGRIFIGMRKNGNR